MYFKMQPNIFHLTIYYKFFIILFIATSYSSNAQQKQFIPPNTQNPFKVKKLNSNPNSILMPKLSVKKNNQKKSKKIKTNKGSFMLNFEDANEPLSKTINTKETHQKLALMFNKWFDLNRDHTFELTGNKTDKHNISHYNYQQKYKGFKVYGANVSLHYKEGKATAVNGKIAEFNNLDTSTILTEVQAINNAKSFKKVAGEINEHPIEKLIYKNTASFSLVYKVRIEASNPFISSDVYVDAKTGEIINDVSLIAHIDTPATANTLYSGQQTITTDLTDGVFTLKDNARNIETESAFNFNLNQNFQDEVLNAESIQNSSENWGEVVKIEKFTINEFYSNWWGIGFIDQDPDIFIVVYDGSGNDVFNTYSRPLYDTLPTNSNPIEIKLDIYAINPPYSVHIYDKDNGYNNSDDLGFVVNLNLSESSNNWINDVGEGSFSLSYLASPFLDAHWGAGKAYDYFLNDHQRQGFDDNNGPTYVLFNTMQSRLNPNNASAKLKDGVGALFCGYGDGHRSNPWVSLDVMAHEYTHLVVNTMNDNQGLAYQGESGALNESFADIFGTCTEFYSSLNPNWLLFEDLNILEDATRSMSNPQSYDQPDTYLTDNKWIDTNLSFDYGGVHINSGVQNHWFYLLSEGGTGVNENNDFYSVTGIGMDKAAQIAYSNLTSYLSSPTSNYQDAFNGSLLAVQNIFGISSQEYLSVREAWYAVGIGNNISQQCSGVVNFTAQTDSFNDGSGIGNYDNNANCKWVITPPGATQISLDFTAFDTESEYDLITVYNGPDESYPEIATWWGNTLPPTINTSQGVGAMCVVFNSDVSNNFGGWSATYSSISTSTTCDAITTIFEASGNFSDGSESGSYVNNQNCFWYIAPPCAQSVTLSFSEFETEQDYDGIIIYDSLNGGNILGVFSGNNIPENITSNTGEMFVRFTSDFSNNFNGFEASYTSSGTEQNALSQTILNTSDTDFLSDGSSSENYCNNTRSSWLIQPPEATSITLSFSEFDLEESSSDGNAIYDYVTIYDGIDATHDVLGTFYGNQLPPNMTSSGGEMYVIFSTDFSSTFEGWSAQYTSTQSIACNTQVLTENSGSLSDESGLQDYSNNSECSWLIQPDNGNIINLTFTEFNTEQDFDGVLIFDGIDESSELIGIFTGSDIPEVISSTGGSMYVLFVSDESIRKEGWSANYDTNSLSIGQTNQLESIKVYPNPTSGIVYISPSEKVLTIQIYDLLGKVIMSEKGVNKVNIRDLSSGVYMIKLSDGDNETIHRIIKD